MRRPNTKRLTIEDARMIRDLTQYKHDRIDAIDIEIDALKAERKQLYKTLNYTQLGLKFDVTGEHVRQIVSGNCFKESGQ